MDASEKHYREDIRGLFLRSMTRPSHKYQQPCNYLTEESSQHMKEHNIRQSKREVPEMTTTYERKPRRHQIEAANASGGDADRYYFDAPRASIYSGDSSRYDDPAQSMRLSSGNAKANKTGNAFGNYIPASTQIAIPTDQDIGDHRFICDTISNAGDFGNRSEGGSSKSERSSKTVVSRKSSHELKKLVKSKCKFQEAVNETIQQMCNPEEFEKSQNDVRHLLFDNSGMQPDPLELPHCKHCTDKNHPSQLSQKDVTTEIGKTDFADNSSGHNSDILTISADDVVNSKVINPMIRKLQRMYLNNLKEEMSLMEDLERLPHKVNEVYKAAIFKRSSV